MTRSPAETPRHIEQHTPSGVGIKNANRADSAGVDHLILKEREMRPSYLADTLAHIEAGGEIPLYLREELLNALRRLDIVEEDFRRERPSLPVNVHNEPINAGAEIRAQKVLTMLQRGYEISPQMRKRFMDALRRM